LNDENTVIDGSSRGPVALPWELEADDYFEFARTDFVQESTRGSVNALGNAKRALHCRIDAVLFVAGFWERAQTERWDFDAKAELLAEIHVVTPQILKRINRLRNKVEHEYAAPENRDQLDDFIDTVELFLASTRHSASHRYDHVDFVSEATDAGVSVHFDGKPVLEARIYREEASSQTLKTETFEEFRALQAAVYGAAKQENEIL
jgi:hypothetical protein